MAETLWPEFQKINSELNAYLQEVTDRVIKKVLHEDSSDAVVVDRPLQLEMDTDQNSDSGQPPASEKMQSRKASDSPPPKKGKKKKRKRKKRRR